MCIGFYMYVYSDGMFVSECVCEFGIICVSNNNYSPLASHRTTTINAQNTFHS